MKCKSTTRIQIPKQYYVLWANLKFNLHFSLSTLSTKVLHFLFKGFFLEIQCFIFFSTPGDIPLSENKENVEKHSHISAVMGNVLENNSHVSVCVCVYI